MATVNINCVKEAILSGEASFSKLCIDFAKLEGYVGVEFENESYAGVLDLMTIYNSFDVVGKAVVLEFVKKMVVSAFNDAMGTNYTWEQVPNNIFG